MNGSQTMRAHQSFEIFHSAHRPSCCNNQRLLINGTFSTGHNLMVFKRIPSNSVALRSSRNGPCPVFWMRFDTVKPGAANPPSEAEWLLQSSGARNASRSGLSHCKRPAKWPHSNERDVSSRGMCVSPVRLLELLKMRTAVAALPLLFKEKT